jgi:hypothetical protein
MGSGLDPDFYNDFLLEMLKHRLLLSLEWK